MPRVLVMLTIDAALGPDLDSILSSKDLEKNRRRSSRTLISLEEAR